MTVAKANKTFMVQASLMIVTYNRHNIFIVQVTGDKILTDSVLVSKSLVVL